MVLRSYPCMYMKSKPVKRIMVGQEVQVLLDSIKCLTYDCCDYQTLDIIGPQLKVLL